jgi:hypothetical protein
MDVKSPQRTPRVHAPAPACAANSETAEPVIAATRATAMPGNVVEEDVVNPTMRFPIRSIAPELSKRHSPSSGANTPSAPSEGVPFSIRRMDQ